MARPRIENGFTRISNEVLEALFKARIDSGPMRVALWVIRSSWGWRRRHAPHLGYRRIGREMNMHEASVRLAFKVLENAGIVKCVDGKWQFEKDYEKWEGAYPTTHPPARNDKKECVAHHAGAYPTTQSAYPATHPLSLYVKERRKEILPEQSSDHPPTDELFEFPIKCARRGGPSIWTLPPTKIAEYRESFPEVDLLRELRKARQWCRDHEVQRKTGRGMPAFLGRWLSKAQKDAMGIPRPSNGSNQPSKAQDDDDAWAEGMRKSAARLAKEIP